MTPPFIDDRTTSTQPALPLLISDGQGREQYRISRVQILNWGAYGGLQSMSVARSGTAIVGPSGRGKSTLLDAIAAVILPNPQEFNQAARDDNGRKRERTVYSYARGQTDQRRDAARRSTTNYLRPPGGPAFPSGAAITWQTGDGRTVTALRLAWVGADVDGPEAITATTIYGFVHDEFDLGALNGLSGVRQGSSPLSKSSLERLIDADRGDLVDPSQARVHAKMRSVMGMGSTDESQRLAMQLLRRAQASKGIFSINALFTEFVLTEPLALTRWDLALEAYREASRLYEEFEAARRRTETLGPLPALAQRYREAGEQFAAKRALLGAASGPNSGPGGEADGAGEGSETHERGGTSAAADRESSAHPAPGARAAGTGPAGNSRIAVWHAERIAEWAEAEISEVRAEKSTVESALDAARVAAESAERSQQATLAQLTAAGGDRSGTVQAKLDRAEDQLQRIAQERSRIETRLAEFQLELPASSGEVDAARRALETSAADAEGSFEAIDEASGQAQARYWQQKDQTDEKTVEIRRLTARRSMIPDDADARRNSIANALDIPVQRLPYAGELLQLRHDARRWEQAAFGILFPLASTLLVDSRDFERVRRHVYEHDMRGSLTFVPVEANAQRHEPQPSSIPALLEIADHSFAGWLSRELADSMNYSCVESEAELDRPRPRWARGTVTPAGMRSGSRGRFVKDDRRMRYPWVGWDNRRLVEELEAELESMRRELQLAEGAAAAAAQRRDAVRTRIERLRALAADLDWKRIDTAPAQASVADFREQLEQANSPETAQLVARLEADRRATADADVRVRSLQQQLERLGERWADLATLQDDAADVVEGSAPLADAERAALADLPFAVPGSATASGVAASLKQAVGMLREQMERHRTERDAQRQAVEGHLAAYRAIDDRTERETDGTIASLPTVLEIHDQLVEDDLPRAKDAWLAKVDADMNLQLRSVLVQIADDERAIRRGLGPINEVLSGVRFRVDSTLSIEAAQHVSAEQREFTRVVTEYTSGSAVRAERDPEEVERSFVRLRRQLAKLDDRSRGGDLWRRRVFDAREHVEFHAVETRADGVKVVHDGVSGMSGGEGQELIAFILGAALRFRLGEGHDGPPRYASVILDEGFVKADSEFTGRALAALRALGFQVLVGAPREKATAFEHYVESVAYINSDPRDPAQVRIYPMTMRQALELNGTV